MQNEVIRQACLSDLDVVTELEAACFPPAEAANRAAFSMRLNAFPHCFWLLEREGQLCAMIGGMTTDYRDLCDAMYEDVSLYAAHGKWLMLFGVATHPKCQHQGYASKLMQRVISDVQERGCAGIVLTCNAELLPFYERFGFVSEGESASQHGGAVWYQMRLDFAAFYKSCIMKGEETHFNLKGRQYLLYGWEQCDGYVLNLADAQGEIIWQTPPMTRSECADAFLAAMEMQSGFVRS